MSEKKLWQKKGKLDPQIEAFTIGHDREFDLSLAEFDVLGSIAHIRMLSAVQLLSAPECAQLKEELVAIYHRIKSGAFDIDEGVEDIHSQIEYLLTEKLGEIGKKIHSGRSRNDQVLLDIRLFSRDRIEKIVYQTRDLFDLLQSLSERYKDVGMPGYTHMQAAMPSSFGLWFAAFAESLTDDLIQLAAAFRIVNKNPLGSAAGYGSSFPLNRQMTTELLGFESMNYNAIYAQAGRGKSERVTLQALASLAETCARMAADIILFMSQNFDFVSFPDTLVTGSSIMPHKKNPDVFEILRARCNRLKSLPGQVMLIMANLTTGYHRDMQVIKEIFIPALREIQDCLQILHFSLSQIQVNENILADARYRDIFSVEEINRLVEKGQPFREAYRIVARQIEEGAFERPAAVKYTHEGSIGNLGNERIRKEMKQVMNGFDFDMINNKLADLLR
jgi:argininosuccinate lyase